MIRLLALRAEIVSEERKIHNGSRLIEYVYSGNWIQRLFRIGPKQLIDMDSILGYGVQVQANGDVSELGVTGVTTEQRLIAKQQVQATRALANAKVDPRMLKHPLQKIQIATTQPPQIAQGGASQPLLESRPQLFQVLETANEKHVRVGYNVDVNEFAELNIAEGVHLAAIGATGTGKTCIAFLLALSMLKSKFHVIVFDGKEGMDWTPFKEHVEYHALSTTNFATLTASLFYEYKRRAQVLKDLSLSNWSKLTPEQQLEHDIYPIMAIYEEFGLVRYTLQLEGHTDTIKKIDYYLTILSTQARAMGIHLFLIDQYPEYWNPQLLSSTKYKLVFKVSQAVAGMVAEQRAPYLKVRGEFMFLGRKYEAWHVEPELPKLLQLVPKTPYQLIQEGVIDGSRRIASDD